MAKDLELASLLVVDGDDISGCVESPQQKNQEFHKATLLRRLVLRAVGLALIALLFLFVAAGSTKTLSTIENTTNNETKTRSVYSLALERFWLRTKATAPVNSIKKNYYVDLKSQYAATKAINSTRLLNSIRIPKAGSSSLSVVARALAGCRPDGYPCCVWPGDPPGSCPRKGLKC